MRALAEREVVVRVALDVEAVRVGELALVVVGRYVVTDHLVARSDVPSRQLARGGAAGRQHRRVHPQHLLDRRRQQRGAGPQPAVGLGVLHERKYATRQGATRRVVPGDHQEEEEHLQLRVGEPLAVDLGLHSAVITSSAGSRRLWSAMASA